MNKLLLCLLCALFASNALSSSDAANTQASSAPTEREVLPGDDFFEYVNGDWYHKTEIPADKRNAGVFSDVRDMTEKQLRVILDGLSQQKNLSSDDIKLRDFYSAFMDQASIEQRSKATLTQALNKIAAIKDRQQLARALGATLRADLDPLNLSKLSTENIFGLWVAQGLQDPLHYQAYLLQGGLGLPDSLYYLSDKADMQKLRGKYLEHIAQMLQLAGMDNAQARAEQVLALETTLARSHVARADVDDVIKGNNPWPVKEFKQKAPGMDWSAFFKAARLDKQTSITVWHPSATIGISTAVATIDLATWRDYLSFHTINKAAYVLPAAFSQQHFAFYGKTLSNTQQAAPRWRQAINASNHALGEALGKLYVGKNFPPEYKNKLQTMVTNIVKAFGQRIDRLEWMTPSTRAEAQAKLKTLYVGVGYPERWQSYAGLKISAHDALGNFWRAEQFYYAQRIGKLGKKVDKQEWAMLPQTVNAVNLPLQNALNFPAAILQTPMFDPSMSDAHNYGAIGAIIGHEIVHSFDELGALFDAQGRLRNWWGKEDLAHFKQAGQALVAQYSAYQPFPDLAVNGQLTLNENIADLAGIAAALDALRSTYHSAHHASDSHDMLQVERAFFTGYAIAWREKSREVGLRQQILTNGHAPARYRTATVRNLDSWYKAFDVQAGQGLYLAPNQRVKVW